MIFLEGLYSSTRIPDEGIRILEALRVGLKSTVFPILMPEILKFLNFQAILKVAEAEVEVEAMVVVVMDDFGDDHLTDARRNSLVTSS